MENFAKVFEGLNIETLKKESEKISNEILVRLRNCEVMLKAICKKLQIDVK